MKCKFEVGQKVVCISSSWVDDRGQVPPCPLPQSGEIVTIAKIIPDDNPMYEILLQLKEYSSPVGFGPQGLPHIPQFAHYDFRPLNERPTETSIEVFKKLLTPTKKNVLEKV